MAKGLQAAPDAGKRVALPPWQAEARLHGDFFPRGSTLWVPSVVRCGVGTDTRMHVCTLQRPRHAPVRQRPHAGRHPVEPAGLALRRTHPARLPGCRHAGGRGRAGVPVRQFPADLHRRLRCAGDHPVRRRPAHPHWYGEVGAWARGNAGLGRRPDHGGPNRLGRHAAAQADPCAGVADWCDRRLDRRCGRFLPSPHRRPSVAPTHWRDARGRVLGRTTRSPSS